jgi:hypothetical protein
MARLTTHNAGSLRRDEKGQVIQGFAPNRIQTMAVAVSPATVDYELDTSDILAIRVKEDLNYQLNSTGDVAVMPTGVTVMAYGVNTIKFESAVVIEIMDSDGV